MVNAVDFSTSSKTRGTAAIPLAPILGAIALIGGFALLLVDKNDFKPAAMP